MQPAVGCPQRAEASKRGKRGVVEVDELTLERIAHYPLPGTNAPAAVRFSPDGRLLTYLWSDDGTLVRQLWGFDLDRNEVTLLVRAEGQGDTDATVSPEEALRRERLRMRGFGITNYAWADNRPVLLVPMLGQLFVSEDGGRHLRVIETRGEAIDPHLNPEGDAVAYVHEGELWVVGTADRAQPMRLTFDASPVSSSGERQVVNGLAEFIAQEEMGRSSGFCWSRDGSRLAFTQVDVSDVPVFTIPHDSEDPPSVEIHRYPFAGRNNARIRLAIIGVDGTGLLWVPLPGDEDRYLARVDWAPDGTLYYQVEARDQRRLDLRCYDPQSGETRHVLTETSEAWINLHDDLRFLVSDGDAAGDYQILWSSERNAYRHLFLYGRDGVQLAQLTAGDWPVDRVVGYHGAWIYFLAGKDTPLERHLYRVARTGGEAERLTTEQGMHAAVLAPEGEAFADLWDSRHHAPSLTLRSTAARGSRKIFRNTDREAEHLALQAPEFLTVTAEDGTTLYAALYRPSTMASERAPLVVSVYGGPHVQQVSDSWGLTVDLRTQFLVRQGYFVLKLDNRGSARRGLRFESAIAGDLGNLEVSDQVAGVRAVAGLPGVDGDRVGVYGWSYGGYMAVMCLLRAPEVFRAAVAGAPVTDWSGYDTHYTERYLQTPAANPHGYLSSSALQHVTALRGALLLIHGMIDENVHFRHSVRLIDALIAARKPFQLLPFPHERHMPRREEDRCFMEAQVIEHFLRYL